ncbi:MAG: HlyD family secretion protein [Proteobacteria bacterium]|nr:HlyD family secretion protein [Pseudomonadota bacterium]
MKNYRLWILGTIAVVMLVVTGVLVVQRLTRAPDTAFLVASGRIEGRLTTLSARSAGRVAEIKADEGRSVERGETLVVLADPALRERINSLAARVRRTEASLDQAERELARNQKLMADGFITLQMMERTRLEADVQSAALREAKASLAEQQRYLDEMTVRAPTTGTVLVRTIERGEWVQPGTPLFSMVDLNQLYLKIYVPEPDIGKIVHDQPARVHVDAFPDRFFPARVSKIASEAEFTPKNVETREERVKLVFAVELALDENPGSVLKPGMPADAVVRLEDGPDWISPVPGKRKLFGQSKK